MPNESKWGQDTKFLHSLNEEMVEALEPLYCINYTGMPNSKTCTMAVRNLVILGVTI